MSHYTSGSDYQPIKKTPQYTMRYCGVCKKFMLEGHDRLFHGRLDKQIGGSSSYSKKTK